MTNARRSTKLCIFILLCVGIAIVHLRELIIQRDNDTSGDGGAILEISEAKVPSSHPLFPTCHPHWKVSTSTGNNNDVAMPIYNRTLSDTLPITRIYFYHFRKAGGSMIRNYLSKVASHYKINLHMKEYNHASAEEEVGSRNDTIYITNMRDPVERSISHFKYSGRWDCEQLIKNESFVPTEENAQSFEAWKETHGFEPSECDIPFSFTSCAVNCYIQTFSGMGCTDNDWFTEYNLALDRLLRYNLIFVFEKFNDANYIEAIENFFGVRGFNKHTDIYCGPESKEANEKVPLHVQFESVLKLTKLNGMDNRLYKDVVSSCWNGNPTEYSFPKVNISRFVAQENRTVIE